MALTRLIYASRLNVSPKDTEYSKVVVDILMKSRNYNRLKNITSALFISNDSCVHVIEGDSTDIAKLMFNVSRDNRHTNIKILDNKKVDERLYGDWSMKLLRAGTNTYKVAIDKIERCDKNAYLAIAKYVDGVFEGIKKVVDFNSSEENFVSPIAKTYKTSILSIKFWPKASQIKLKNRGTLLCSMLLNKNLTFNEILQRLAPVSEKELTLDLQELDSLGVLQVNHNPGSDTFSENIVALPEKQKKARFSQLFKKFISAKSNR